MSALSGRTASHLNRFVPLFFKIDGSRGTGAPIKRSGLSAFDFCSIAGNGDADHSELELELPGDRSLFSKKTISLLFEI